VTSHLGFGTVTGHNHTSTYALVYKMLFVI